MARLVTDACKAEANSRLVALRLATLILRMRAGWAELFGDLDTAAIALAVASIHADRLLRAEDLFPEVRNLEIRCRSIFMVAVTSPQSPSLRA